MSEAENNSDAPVEMKENGLAEGTAPEFKWYIAKTLTGQENKIAKTLRERIVNHKLGEFFAEILVPEESVVSHVGGKKRTIKKKFFIDDYKL